LGRSEPEGDEHPTIPGPDECTNAGRHCFLKQHDGFSFWPKALADDAARQLYDRRGGGIVARTIDLPLTILDADQ
jgi:hypothetical protein